MRNNISTKILVCILILSTLLCACEKKVDHTANRSLCGNYTFEFIQVLIDPNPEKLAIILHPSAPFTAQQIVDEMNNYEQSTGVDFSEKGNYNWQTEIYNDFNQLEGSAYKGKGNYRIPNTTEKVYFYIVFVVNDDGTGIYSFEIEE